MQVKQQEKPELPSVWTRMCTKNSEWPDKVHGLLSKTVRKKAENVALASELNANLRHILSMFRRTHYIYIHDNNRIIYSFYYQYCTVIL